MYSCGSLQRGDGKDVVEEEQVVLVLGLTDFMDMVISVKKVRGLVRFNKLTLGLSDGLWRLE